MKYFLFESGDVIGPFSVEELLARKGFGGHNLVCPVEHSEEETYWKEAYLYPEFGLETPAPVNTDSPQEEAFPSEMRDSVAQWQSVSHVDVDAALEKTQQALSIPLARVKEDAPQSGKENAEEEKIKISSLLLEKPEQTDIEQSAAREEVVIQQLAAPANPIEEYFNSVRSGDLGNILGIPDPKANSDMNLARMLEKQFEKTDPNSVPIPAEKEEKDPFDSFMSSIPAEQNTFSFTAFDTLNEKDIATQTNLQNTISGAQKPVLDLQEPEETKETPLEAKPNSSPEIVIPLQEDDPTDSTVSSILEGTWKADKDTAELTEPIKQVPTIEGEKTSSALAKGKVITCAVPEKKRSSSKWLWAALGMLLLLTGIALTWHQYKQDLITTKPVELVAQPVTPVEKPVQEEMSTNTPEPLPVAPVAKPTPEDQAKEIVQQHLLDNNRGTVANYLAKRYAAQLADGYTAMWSAEPLHRNMYVVKYRLAKTRQEPIVYIFQADIVKKKLTGALNNITLDLVGKTK